MYNNVLMMDNRQLIPRWHTSRKLHKFNYPGRIEGTQRSFFEEDYWFQKSLAAWREQPSTANATDLFVRFIQSDEREHPIYLAIHRQLLDQYHQLPNAIKQLVCPELKLLDPLASYTTETNNVRVIINKLKNLVKHNPRDSLSWMDLGFYYSVVYELEKAIHCVNVAKSLDPNHPFIARAYSRFLVHMDEPEQAVWFLKSRPNILSNPLLLSAYIAITSAFDIRNPNIKKAISLIDGWSGDKLRTSELAACVGTIEFNNGSIQKAKKHFQTALNSPSENVISHVEWLHHKHQLKLKDMPYSATTIEGGINALYREKQFGECRTKLVEMYQFQPYSTGPIIDAGYLSLAALDDPEFVLNLSDKRIPHTHMNFGELNNLIVAKLLLKQTDNLDVDLRLLAKRVNVEDPQSVATLKATTGMAFMEGGMFTDGIKLYEAAIHLLEKQGLGRALCIAKYFFSKQLSKFDAQKSETLRIESVKLAKRYDVLEIASSLNSPKTLVHPHGRNFG